VLTADPTTVRRLFVAEFGVELSVAEMAWHAFLEDWDEAAVR
jgi:hypothetical protein